MQTRPRVVYWDNLPAPYAVERYNELAKRGHLDFSVWFVRRSDPDRSWNVDESSWRFHGEYVPDPSANVESARRFVARCDEVRPDLLLSLYGERPFVVGHALVKARGIRSAVLALPTYDRWVRRAWWKEALKKVIFRSADAVKVPGPDGRAFAERYGMCAERVFHVTQSSNLSTFGQRLSGAERSALRAKLGVEGCTFLYVGRFLKTKGLFDLIDAFKTAKAVHPNLSLLLVGDGVDENHLRRAADGVGGVVFHPFVQPADLWRVYRAADVFVFPTLGDPHGQVIEEAHAAGLPVITSDAAGDVRRRVADGVSGYVVSAGAREQFASRMLTLASDEPLRDQMGAAGCARVAAWGHATWAGDFERFVTGSLSLPKRRSMSGAVVTMLGWLLTASIELLARLQTIARKARRVGVFTAAGATVVARLNRLAMWTASLPWRARRPQLTLKKCGTKHGGWIVPIDLIPPRGVCYAIGVGCDTSFEDDLLRRTAAQVWSFDPTPSSITYVAKQSLDPTRFTFCALGVSDKRETARFYEFPERKFETYSMVNLWKTDGFFEAPCETVAGLMARFGHQSLSLLKIAADGSEWRVLESVLAAGIRTDVLCVVFCQPSPFWRVAAMIRRLRRAGLRCVARDEWKFTFVREAALSGVATQPVETHAA